MTRIYLLVVLFTFVTRINLFALTGQHVGEIGDIIFRNFATDFASEAMHNAIWVGHYPLVPPSGFKSNDGTIVEAVGRGAATRKAIRYNSLQAFKDTALYRGELTWIHGISQEKRKAICLYVMTKAEKYPTYYNYFQGPPERINTDSYYSDGLDNLNKFSCAWLVEFAYRYNEPPLATDDGILPIVDDLGMTLIPLQQFRSPNLSGSSLFHVGKP
ncbi:MAG: hypothetical protein PHQ23_09505 [Candidatus Wallbacteria bacterium]|nr:hypothetical protein [Candidatus Wallbacteria bacterium]